MSRINDVTVKTENGFENLNTTKIHRTLVEHGIRVVNNGPSSTISSIVAKKQQHQDEQDEMQELNFKFVMYLEHVRDLENFNGQILSELENLKQGWTKEMKQLESTYGSQLDSVRNMLDDSIRDRTFQELQLERHEYDLWQTQQCIATLENDTANELNKMQKELHASSNLLEQLKEKYDRNLENLTDQRTVLNNLLNESSALQDELVDRKLERMMAESDLQTLREQAAFQNAIYQTQKKDIVSFNLPTIDISQFYHKELIRAIAEIRHDFEILSKSQSHEIEEYYRIKTEQIEEIARENKRQRSLNSSLNPNGQSFDVKSLIDLKHTFKSLQMENDQLEAKLNCMEDDLRSIQTDRIHDNQKLDNIDHQLRQETVEKQTIIDGALENNVSLRFELSTYRTLLNSELQRVDRTDQEISSNISYLPSDHLSSQEDLSSTQVNASFQQHDTLYSCYDPLPAKFDTQTDRFPTKLYTSTPEFSAASSRYDPSSTKFDAPISQVDPSLTSIDTSTSIFNSSTPQVDLSSSRSVDSSSQRSSLSSSTGITSKYNQGPLNEITPRFQKQKMKTETSAIDCIIFDSIDLINDFVVILHNRSFDRSMSLGDWVIIRRNDRQEDIIYRLPSSCILKAGKKLRILSKHSPQPMKQYSCDDLVADTIETWGCGKVMKTILFSNSNEEMASITQTCIPI